jgi:hypothetical protein
MPKRILVNGGGGFIGGRIPLCVAEFEYINMDVRIERGRKVADRLNQADNVVAQPATEVGVQT